jgi:hypothetical protein
VGIRAMTYPNCILRNASIGACMRLIRKILVERVIVALKGPNVDFRIDVLNPLSRCSDTRIRTVFLNRD